jgi:hypothetical protein
MPTNGELKSAPRARPAPPKTSEQRAEGEARTTEDERDGGTRRRDHELGVRRLRQVGHLRRAAEEAELDAAGVDAEPACDDRVAELVEEDGGECEADDHHAHEPAIRHEHEAEEDEEAEIDLDREAQEPADAPRLEHADNLRTCRRMSIRGVGQPAARSAGWAQ